LMRISCLAISRALVVTFASRDDIYHTRPTVCTSIASTNVAGTDLDRKIGSANFNIDQLKMGRMAFMNALTTSLATEPEDAEVVS